MFGSEGEEVYSELGSRNEGESGWRKVEYLGN